MVQGLGFRIWDSGVGFMMWGSRFRVRIQGLCSGF
jgi:hypothetical protein